MRNPTPARGVETAPLRGLMPSSNPVRAAEKFIAERMGIRELIAI